MCDIGSVLDPAGLFSTGSAPGQPNSSAVSKQYLGLLDAFASGDPKLLSTEEQFQPGFENLDLQGIAQSLMGGNGTPGYLGLLTNNVIPALTGATNTANTSARTSAVGDLTALGPSGNAAIRASDPGGTGLLDALTKTTTDQLNLGTQLDPNSVSQVNSSVNANWSNRGLGASAPASLDDALQLYAGGQNLLSQREGAANSVVNQNANTYEDPILSMIGINSSAPGMAPGVTATGSSAAGGGVPQFNTGDALNTSYNEVATHNIDAANVANAGTGLQQTARSY